MRFSVLRGLCILILLISLATQLQAAEPAFAQLYLSSYKVTINNVPINSYSINGRCCVYLSDLKAAGVQVDSAYPYTYQIIGYKKPAKNPDIKLVKSNSSSLGRVDCYGSLSIGNINIPSYNCNNKMLIHVTDLSRMGSVTSSGKNINVSIDREFVNFSEGFSLDGYRNCFYYPPNEEHYIVFVKFNNANDMVWAVGQYKYISQIDGSEDEEAADTEELPVSDYGYKDCDYAHYKYFLFFKADMNTELTPQQLYETLLQSVKKKIDKYTPSVNTVAFLQDYNNYSKKMAAYNRQQADIDAKAIAKKIYQEYLTNKKRPLKIVKYPISYPSIYTAKITFEIKNVSSKSVDSFMIDFHLYDKSGKPVYLDRLPRKNVYAMNCYFKNSGYMMSGGSGTWTIDSLSSDVAKVHPVIKKVHFTNGTLWTPAK